MQRIKSIRSTRCAEHMNSICAQGLRLALYKGSHATAARLCTKGWLPDGVRQLRLTGETYEDTQLSGGIGFLEHLWGPSPLLVRRGAEVAQRADQGAAHRGD